MNINRISHSALVVLVIIFIIFWLTVVSIIVLRLRSEKSFIKDPELVQFDIKIVLERKPEEPSDDEIIVTSGYEYNGTSRPISNQPEERGVMDEREQTEEKDGTDRTY